VNTLVRVLENRVLRSIYRDCEEGVNKGLEESA
jgi:hypothetical protein